MPLKILADDWSDYDSKKSSYSNATYIDCTIAWEVEYLAQKVFKAYPEYKLEIIKNAVVKCRNNFPVPYKRVSFMTCLMIILRENSKSDFSETQL